MSEIPSYPPVIAELFAPKLPLRFLEPIDYPSEKRKLRDVTPVGGFLAKLKEYNQENNYESTEGLQQREQRLKRERNKKLHDKMTQDLQEWDPLADPHIADSDPHKTLFVGRLHYKVSEVDLQQFFSKYGNIRKLRLVRDKSTNESKGYAFVEFEQESDCRECLKSADRSKLLDREILVDIERSRLVKNWKPRRLGGGLGGRHYTKIAKQREAVRERRDARGFNGSQRPNGPSRPARKPYDRPQYERSRNDRRENDRNDSHYQKGPPRGPQYRSYGGDNYRRGGRY